MKIIVLDSLEYTHRICDVEAEMSSSAMPRASRSDLRSSPNDLTSASWYLALVKVILFSSAVQVLYLQSKESPSRGLKMISTIPAYAS